MNKFKLPIRLTKSDVQGNDDLTDCLVARAIKRTAEHSKIELQVKRVGIQYAVISFNGLEYTAIIPSKVGDLIRTWCALKGKSCLPRKCFTLEFEQD